MNSEGDFVGEGYKKNFFEYLDSELKADLCLSEVVMLIPFLPRLLAAISAFGLFAVVINTGIGSHTLLRYSYHISFIAQ
jgi:hypothetical protein